MPMLKSLKEKAVGAGREGLGRAKAYREEQVRHRGEVRDVREKVTRSELEQEAAPIAKKYGISLEEAIIWLQSEKKKQQRAATVERMGTWGDDLGKGQKITGKTRRISDREYNGDIEEYQEFLGGNGRFEEPTTTTKRKTKKRVPRSSKKQSMTEGMFFSPSSREYDESDRGYPEQGEESGVENIFFKAQPKRRVNDKKRPRHEEEDVGKGLMSAFIPGGR